MHAGGAWEAAVATGPAGQTTSTFTVLWKAPDALPNFTVMWNSYMGGFGLYSNGRLAVLVNDGNNNGWNSDMLGVPAATIVVGNVYLIQVQMTTPQAGNVTTVTRIRDLTNDTALQTFAGEITAVGGLVRAGPTTYSIGTAQTHLDGTYGMLFVSTNDNAVVPNPPVHTHRRWRVWEFLSKALPFLWKFL